jgi:hypothetical protein
MRIEITNKRGDNLLFESEEKIRMKYLTEDEIDLLNLLKKPLSN